MPSVLKRGPSSRKSGSKQWSAKNSSQKRSRSWKRQALSEECSILRGWPILLSCARQTGNGGFASTLLMLTKLVPKIHFPCRALTRLLTPWPDVICFHFLTHTQDTIRSSWLKRMRRRPHSSLRVARTVSYGCLLV